jgi:hypothetical protein
MGCRHGGAYGQSHGQRVGREVGVTGSGASGHILLVKVEDLGHYVWGYSPIEKELFDVPHMFLVQVVLSRPRGDHHTESTEDVCLGLRTFAGWEGGGGERLKHCQGQYMYVNGCVWMDV